MKNLNLSEIQSVNGGHPAVAVAVVAVAVWYYYGGGKEAIEQAIAE